MSDRELDAKVAERVMGWEKIPYAGWYEIGMFKTNAALVSAPFTWSPSTDISAAWLVVEKMLENKFEIFLSCEQGNYFDCYINNTIEGTWNRDGMENKRVGEAVADTMPLAICRAALKAVEAE